jgi:hypothetical protein
LHRRARIFDSQPAFRIGKDSGFGHLWEASEAPLKRLGGVQTLHYN